MGQAFPSPLREGRALPRGIDEAFIFQISSKLPKIDDRNGDQTPPFLPCIVVPILSTYKGTTYIVRYLYCSTFVVPILLFYCSTYM